MLHLIAFARISGQQFGYDYVVKEDEYQKLIQQKKAILDNLSPESRLMFTFHVINSDSKDHSEIEKEDPYFAGTTWYKTFDEFISAINTQMGLTSSDVASFLLRKYPKLNNHRFAFHKILYYIYADYLVENGFPLFNARFVAFDKGPVEFDIYRKAKYQKNELLRNTSFELKVQSLSDREKILKLISKDVDKYQNYYDQVWDSFRSSDADVNLTHKENTPWSIAHAKGKNSSISDSDIVKYHKLEVL